MIIINSGMFKSGTTLLMSYQNDLIRSCYPDNGIGEMLKHSYGGYIERIDDKKANKLCKIHERFGPFVVKTHTEPTPAIQELISSGLAKATFSFRDPRDIILSALDHGKRSRETSDPTGAFANVTNFSRGFIYAGISIKTYESWLSFDNSLFIRYEELMEDKLDIISRMSKYFETDLEESVLKEIYSKNELNKTGSLNYNKGTVRRWKNELNPDQLALCNKSWKDSLRAMGYQLQ